MKYLLPLLCAFVLFPSARAQTATPAGATQNTHEIDVPGNQPWTDTGVDIHAGQTFSLAASGKLEYLEGASTGPEGLPRGWRDLLRSLPVNSAGRGALIGRMSADDAAQPFLVGPKFESPGHSTGRLFLGINGPSGDTANGSFHVTITISGVAAKSGSSTPVASASTAKASTSAATGVGAGLTASGSTAASQPPPADGAAVSATATPVAPETTTTLPADILKKIPRRIADKDGNPGDMVNFLIVGSEEQLKSAFQAAGWVQVDRDTKDAVLQALVASLSKQAYLTMPMSQLYLFGRPQDFGFAHAEPVTVVTTRHHLRLWKSTLTVEGQPLWVGAATHDMGLERDQRNGKLTHHIDPNVDDERDFVSRSLSGSGYVSQHSNEVPPDPLKDAKTATGGGFHSNGEVLVLWLGQ